MTNMSFHLSPEQTHPRYSKGKHHALILGANLEPINCANILYVLKDLRRLRANTSMVLPEDWEGEPPLRDEIDQTFATIRRDIDPSRDWFTLYVTGHSSLISVPTNNDIGSAPEFAISTRTKPTTGSYLVDKIESELGSPRTLVVTDSCMGYDLAHKVASQNPRAVGLSAASDWKLAYSVFFANRFFARLADSRTIQEAFVYAYIKDSGRKNRKQAPRLVFSRDGKIHELPRYLQKHYE